MINHVGVVYDPTIKSHIQFAQERLKQQTNSSNLIISDEKKLISIICMIFIHIGMTFESKRTYIHASTRWRLSNCFGFFLMLIDIFITKQIFLYSYFIIAFLEQGCRIFQTYSFPSPKRRNKYFVDNKILTLDCAKIVRT